MFIARPNTKCLCPPVIKSTFIFRILTPNIPQVTRLPDNKKLWIEVGPLTWYSTGCEIRLDRNVKKYLINYYIPSGLLVIASWVSILPHMSKICLTRDTIRWINIVSRCFQNKNNNWCETKICKNAICLLCIYKSISGYSMAWTMGQQDGQIWICKFVNT